MRKTKLKYYSLLLLFFGLLNCSDNSNSQKKVVVSVGEKKLFQQDLSELIPNGIHTNDSILFAEDYIEKWIKQQLLMQKAEENLSQSQKDVSKELKEYRNSLIIYKYKNELMRQRMDTNVTDSQIEEFYTANPENFNLSKNIVKAIFVKVPTELADPELIKNYCNDTSNEGMSQLKEYCSQYAKGFDIFIDNWVDFEVVSKNIPQEIEDHGRFLSSNDLIEMNDSNYYYLVSIQDYKLKNDLAPLKYVKKSIKNLILNRRKIEFLKEIEENIYTEGIRKNKFKIHNQKINETE